MGVRILDQNVTNYELDHQNLDRAVFNSNAGVNNLAGIVRELAKEAICSANDAFNFAAGIFSRSATGERQRGESARAPSQNVRRQLGQLRTLAFLQLDMRRDGFRAELAHEANQSSCSQPLGSRRKSITDTIKISAGRT